MQVTTELVARLPRCRCPDHGVKRMVPPWVGKHSRFTFFFKVFAIEILKAARTVKATAALLGLSWDPAQMIMDRAVERARERREANPIVLLIVEWSGISSAGPRPRTGASDRLSAHRHAILRW